MSFTETHKGKFRLLSKTTDETVEYINENLSEYWTIERYNGRIGIDETQKFLDDYWNADKEFPYSIVEMNDQFVLVEFIEHKQYDEDESIMDLTQLEDGSYEFFCQFYNGGACLDEVIGDMLENSHA